MNENYITEVHDIVIVEINLNLIYSMERKIIM